MITKIAFLRFFTLLALIALPGALSAATSQVWLLVSNDLLDSVVSQDPTEKDPLVQAGWKVSGTGAVQKAPQKGAVPLHRLARPGANATDRMLETDPSKVAGHVKDGFTDEGVLGYVSSEEGPGLVPVHHFTKEGKHFWAIDESHQAQAKEMGWKPAGVSFWLWPVSTKSEPAAKVPAKP